MNDRTSSYEPEQHYDRVTAAWRHLLGEELHYGVFDTGSEPLAEATRRLTQLMLDAAQITSEDEVLDIGCGTGAPACHLAAVTGARVTGISTSSEGVAQSLRRAAEVGLGERVTFAVRDGMDNGFPSGSFSRVWALESSHLMRDRGKLLGEMSRVLRPGGRLVLCDIVLRRPLDFSDVRRLRSPLAVLRDVFGDARMEPLDEYRRLAEANGLIVEQLDDLTTVTRPTFVRWRENADRHREHVIALLGEEYWQTFVQSCEILAGFWDDGTLGYGLLAASAP